MAPRGKGNLAFSHNRQINELNWVRAGGRKRNNIRFLCEGVRKILSEIWMMGFCGKE